MKKVLLSVHPKWCELIFSGKKTIEVRKTAPKLEPPFEVLVYFTRKPVLVMFNGTGRHISEYDKTYCYDERSGKVIGSFICDKITRYESEFWDDDTYERIQEPWEPLDFEEYGEYEYDTIGENGVFCGKGHSFSEKSCLTWKELRKYIGKGIKNFYGWHISEPKLFDKPKELSELAVYGKCAKECSEYDICIKYDSVESRFECPDFLRMPLKRAPQSWCYVDD